jgi:NAD(P)-dependent dehydrogenase (short-subunit alcohol dehydrogenase family)
VGLREARSGAHSSQQRWDYPEHESDRGRDRKMEENPRHQRPRLLGLCIATREAVKVMKVNKIDGHIIHINSVSGHGVPNVPGVNVYAASKHAVTALTETLRQEFNHPGLKIKITVKMTASK